MLQNGVAHAEHDRALAGAWILTETVWCQSRGTRPLHSRCPKPGALRGEMVGGGGRERESGAEGSVLAKVGGVCGKCNGC